MIFEQISVGGDRNFAYLIGDAASGQAVVVDPAYRPGLVLDRAAAHGLEVELLVNTHGHADHSNGNSHVLANSAARLVTQGNTQDGQVLALGALSLTVIHTPGHSADSLCLLVADGQGPAKLISGDTLFVGKVGGTGFGEDARQEYRSLHEKLMTLPPQTEVWPGHDVGTRPQSTIGEERATNPFILQPDCEAFVDLKRTWTEYKRKHGIK